MKFHEGAHDEEVGKMIKIKKLLTHQNDFFRNSTVTLLSLKLCKCNGLFSREKGL